MKTIARILVITACLALAGGTMLAAEELTASITKITGKVEIMTDSGWAPAKQGQIISSGTTISTGFRSTAELTLGNSIVTVKALTRLTLAELAENAGVITTNLNLRVGKVSAEVKTVAGKTNDFKVKSPISTASVRGTGFDFDGETLEVTHGTVDFADTAGNIVAVPVGEVARTDVSGSGGMVTNEDIMSEESTVVADAGSDFGDSNASAFVDATSDFVAVEDFSEVIEIDEIVEIATEYQETVEEVYEELDPTTPTGTLTITIR
jgi:hypothetical protein